VRRIAANGPSGRPAADVPLLPGAGMSSGGGCEK
jgi:hypothetical protein